MEKFDIDYRKRKDGLMWIPVFTGMTIYWNNDNIPA